jgi:CheY-like chemotaxis protein/HPt (histidine-containing phosphotransfer) domain-containing protein
VVDDVAANRLVARAMLTGAGHHVVLVEDGAAALAAAENDDFDLILMDLQMPVMDGLEAARRIRALPPPQGTVPVIAVTASVLPEQVDACREAGMDAHISKPIDRESLLRLVSSYSRRTAAPARQPAGSTLPPVLDMATCNELMRDVGAASSAVLAELVAELRRGAETLAVLDAAAGDSEIRTAVHRLVGVCRTFGAARMVWALEQLVASPGEADCDEKLAQARAVLEETLPEVLRWTDASRFAGAAREERA